MEFDATKPLSEYDIINKPFDFEARIQTIEQQLERESAITEMLELLNGLAENQTKFQPEDVAEVINHANEAYLLLSPLSSTNDEDEKQNVIRFKTWQDVSPDFKETNWEHTAKMVRAYCRLGRNFPRATENFDSKTVLEMILWHDAPEFLFGDMPVDQQNELSKVDKKQRENIAVEVIRKNAEYGEEACQIMTEYEERQSKEAKLVKVLDILAGLNSFYELLVEHLPEDPEKFEVTTGQGVFDFAKYITEHEFPRLRERFEPVFRSLNNDFGYEPQYVDDDGPLEEFFFCLGKNSSRYNNFIYSLQFDIGKPDFRESLKYECGIQSLSKEKFDLFYDENEPEPTLEDMLKRPWAVYE